MTLNRGERHCFGDNVSDILTFLDAYCREAGYPGITTISSACSRYKSDTFKVGFSELVGVAERRCVVCGTVEDAGDTGLRKDIRVDMDEPVCECAGDSFQLACAKAYDENPKSGGTFFLGLRCVQCGLIANYADWEIQPECHTVTLAFRLSDDNFGNQSEVVRLMGLERQLNECVESAGVGQCDGHEIGNGYFVMFFDGDNADELYSLLEQTLQVDSRKGYAIKRYGPPGSDEVRIDW